MSKLPMAEKPSPAVIIRPPVRYQYPRPDPAQQRAKLIQDGWQACFDALQGPNYVKSPRLPPYAQQRPSAAPPTGPNIVRESRGRQEPPQTQQQPAATPPARPNNAKETRDSRVTHNSEQRTAAAPRVAKTPSTSSRMTTVDSGVHKPANGQKPMAKKPYGGDFQPGDTLRKRTFTNQHFVPVTAFDQQSSSQISNAGTPKISVKVNWAKPKQVTPGPPLKVLKERRAQNKNIHQAEDTAGQQDGHRAKRQKLEDQTATSPSIAESIAIYIEDDFPAAVPAHRQSSPLLTSASPSRNALVSSVDSFRQTDDMMRASRAQPGQNAFFPGISDRTLDLGHSMLTPKKGAEVINIDDGEPQTDLQKQSKPDLYSPLLAHIRDHENHATHQQDREADGPSPYFSTLGVKATPPPEMRHRYRGGANDTEGNDVQYVGARSRQQTPQDQNRPSGRLRRPRKNSIPSREPAPSPEQKRQSSRYDDNSVDELQGPATIGSAVRDRMSREMHRRSHSRRRSGELESTFEIPESPTSEGPKTASDIQPTVFTSEARQKDSKRTSKSTASRFNGREFQLKSLMSSHLDQPLLGPALVISYEEPTKTFRVVVNGRLKPLDPAFTFSKLQSCIWSTGGNEGSARLAGVKIGPDVLWFHLEFEHVQSVRSFVDVARDALGNKRVNFKSMLVSNADVEIDLLTSSSSDSEELRSVMSKVESRQYGPRYPTDPDELSLLRKREQRRQSSHSTLHVESRTSAIPRETIISQLRTGYDVEDDDTRTHRSKYQAKYRSSPEPVIEYDHYRADPYGDEALSRRIAQEETMARRTRSASKRQRPGSMHEQISVEEAGTKNYDLGDPWDAPIVYPETGKKRTTVHQHDLERLEPGVWLNDALIEFYILWLKVQFRVSESQIYIFPTQFYTVLTTGAPRGGINYNKVERWTKDDIFTREFVVIPINDGAHWYVAIVCNLPHLKRKLALDDDGLSEDERAGPTSQLEISVDSKPATAAEIPSYRIDETEPMSIDHNMTEKYRNMTLADQRNIAAESLPAGPSDMGQEDEAKKPTPSSPSRRTPDGVDTSHNTQTTPIGLFAAAKTSSTTSKKPKQRGGPGVRKYDANVPAVVLLDSLGNAHPDEIRNIKDYIIAEGLAKRGLAITRTDMQGINTYQGIPRQNNGYDCGLYVLGYLHKFLENPKEFGRKLLERDFDLETDWPNMMPLAMRDGMRTTLLDIYAKQKADRDAKRKEKREKKKAQRRAAGLASMSPPSKDASSSSNAGPQSPWSRDGGPTANTERISTTDRHAAPTSSASSPVKPTFEQAPRTQQNPKSTTPPLPTPDQSLRTSVKNNAQGYDGNEEVMLLEQEPQGQKWNTPRASSMPAPDQDLNDLAWNEQLVQAARGDPDVDRNRSVDLTTRPKTRRMPDL